MEQEYDNYPIYGMTTSTLLTTPCPYCKAKKFYLFSTEVETINNMESEDTYYCECCGFQTFYQLWHIQAIKGDINKYSQQVKRQCHNIKSKKIKLSFKNISKFLTK